MLPKELNFMPEAPPAKKAELLLKSLTPAERLFCSAYDGDGAYACRVAGYEGNKASLAGIARSLLSRPEIQEVIKYKAEVSSIEAKAIASKQERMMFYSSLMKNIDPYKFEEKDQYGNITEVNIDLKDRIKAAELLSKASGDFVDRLDINHNHTITDLVMKSYDVKDSKEVLEAEWKEMHEAKQKARSMPQPRPEDDNSFGGLL